MKRILIVLGMVFGLFLIVRAIVEPFVINMSDPSTYREDWGGPHLVGVLAVHCLPGMIAAGVMVWAVVHRRRNRQASASLTS